MTMTNFNHQHMVVTGGGGNSWQFYRSKGTDLASEDLEWEQVRSMLAPVVADPHQTLNFIREDARRRWARDWKEASHVVGAGTLLTPDALTIGFARRFATYKRADLVFRDIDRLRRLLTHSTRPTSEASSTAI